MLSLDAAKERAVPLARELGRAFGRELAALDFDIDFAPVLDCNSNPDNPDYRRPRVLGGPSARRRAGAELR